jgi:hypothetical protein
MRDLSAEVREATNKEPHVCARREVHDATNKARHACERRRDGEAAVSW